MPTETRNTVRFEPPRYLFSQEGRHNLDGHRLRRMALKMASIKVKPDETLSGKQMNALHPLVRENLRSVSDKTGLPTGRDLRKRIREVIGAERLLGMGIRGIRFIPAEADITQVLEAKDQPRASHIQVHVHFKPPELPKEDSLRLDAYLEKLSPDEYLIRIAGMGMHASKVSQRAPARIKRDYHHSAPALGIAILLESLRKNGAKRVLFSGPEHQTDRRGFKRPEMKREVEKLALEGDSNAADLLRKWETLSESRALAELQDFFAKRTAAKDPKLEALQRSQIKKHGFAPEMINRYYIDLPERFPGKRVKLEEPLELPDGFSRIRAGHSLYELKVNSARHLSRFMSDVSTPWPHRR